MEIRSIDLDDFDLFWGIPNYPTPEIVACFQSSSPQSKWLAWGVYEENRLLGWLGASLFPAINQSLLEYFHFSPNQENLPAALALMDKLLLTLKENKISLVQTGYDRPAKALEYAMEQSGWRIPELVLEKFLFDPKTFSPPWYESSIPVLPPGYTLIPWNQLSPEALYQCRSITRTYPEADPFSPSDIVPDPLNSLALMQESRLVGWVLTDRFPPHYLRYTGLYVLPSLRSKGVGIALLRAAIQRHVAQEPHTIGLAAISPTNSPPSWLRFVQHHLAPSSFQRIEQMTSWKIL